MRVTVMDFLLPRRVVISRVAWIQLRWRGKAKLWWNALKVRGRVMINNHIPPGHVYVLDTRYTFNEVISMPSSFAHLEPNERTANRMMLYGQLHYQQGEKRKAQIYDITWGS